MRICPLTSDECTKLITPLPKTILLMTPSKEKTTPELKELVDNIKKIIEKHSFKYIEGAEIIKYGDFVCSICSHILGCCLGIAISKAGIPPSTLCNIFWEKGLMEGFGKPVILFVDDDKYLPSDFKRTFAVFTEKKDYVKRFDALVKDLTGIERRHYYSNVLGDIAFEAGDYEKAGVYYQEAYLIQEKQEDLKKIKNLINLLKELPEEYEGFKDRLQRNLLSFIKGLQKKKF